MLEVREMSEADADYDEVAETGKVTIEAEVERVERQCDVRELFE